MSILIKGMEMPKAGNWKTIRIYYDGTCAEPNWQGDCKYMQGCEAVPVPPHGRLIDAEALIDAIIAKYIRHERNRELVFAVAEIKQDLADIINELPTIIPADLAEEGE